VIFDELEEQQQKKQLQVQEEEEEEIEFPTFSASPIGEIDEIENLFTTVW
jgi:hypothetical protein